MESRFTLSQCRFRHVKPQGQGIHVETLSVSLIFTLHVSWHDDCLLRCTLKHIQFLIFSITLTQRGLDKSRESHECHALDSLQSTSCDNESDCTCVTLISRCFHSKTNIKKGFCFIMKFFYQVNDWPTDLIQLRWCFYQV